MVPKKGQIASLMGWFSVGLKKKAEGSCILSRRHKGRSDTNGQLLGCRAN